MMKMSLCGNCGSAYYARTEHNGVGYVWHGICLNCGTAHNPAIVCDVQKTTTATVFANGNEKYTYQVTYEDYDEGDPIGHGETIEDAIKDLEQNK